MRHSARDPGQNAAITLLQITAVLLSERMSNLDVMIKMQALTMIRDQIADAFMRADRKLQRDHAKRAWPG